MKRRLFVATPLLLTGALTADQWTLLAGARPPVPGDVPPMARVAGTAFGTVISLCALGDAQHDAQATREALRRAMREVQHIDALLSLHRADSQLSVLNRTGVLDGAHEHVLRNLHFAAQLSDLTSGAFDITVQPLWELFAQARLAGTLPAPQAIARTRQLVDYRAVRIEADRVRLDRPGARITLNSLAQGYAVDVVLQILREEGLNAALIDTGEIGNLGTRTAAQPWTVGVQHPRERRGLSALIGMDGRVLSTSGDYATAFTSDFRYHHIFDPATGVSPTAYSSTVVLARSGLIADGLSTALMVIDRAAGAALLRAFAGADAIWMDKQARLEATAGVPLREA
jgi:thiamine biosynthesis lipoprotein